MSPSEPLILDDLVRATGLTKRQIRYYITRGLVPGSGTSKGPYAAYPPETLERLLRIVDLKARPVGPTARRLTLEEIKYELGPIGAQPAAAGQMQEPPTLHSRRTRISHEPVPENIREDLSFLEAQIPNLSDAPTPDDDGPQIMAFIQAPNLGRQLVHNLLDQLQAIVHDDEASTKDTQSLTRIPATDYIPIEINIPHPTDTATRDRLRFIAVSLHRLLAQEDPS